MTMKMAEFAFHESVGIQKLQEPVESESEVALPVEDQPSSEYTYIAVKSVRDAMLGVEDICKEMLGTPDIPKIEEPVSEDNQQTKQAAFKRERKRTVSFNEETEVKILEEEDDTDPAPSMDLFNVTNILESFNDYLGTVDEAED